MKTTRLITAIVCAAGALSPVWADDGYGETMPGGSNNLWYCILIIAVAAGAIAVAAFKNAKRTHLD
ncbi:MAG TPA: hypothetical protein VFJ30_17645 [Phycisphaerae bacterium]|nr:hypothetical protein [Phycisphaerae bacterium]